ncbi:protein MODIFIER OF SNC1 11 [Abeliophyllum distichum]|uniref:Protein MODIFIER OF SNC1 11 n=1 Tax=Abeliophyllum distichum TaxID=126358 RepID=A0ABD1RA38_9LAMI
MATVTSTKVENPKNAVTQSSASNSKPHTTEDPHSSSASTASPTHGGGGGESSEKSTTGATTKNSDSSTEGAVIDIHKKMKRAERFGMPVQLYEQEKRNSRAERYFFLTFYCFQIRIVQLISGVNIRVSAMVHIENLGGVLCTLCF